MCYAFMGRVSERNQVLPYLNKNLCELEKWVSGRKRFRPVDSLKNLICEKIP